MDYKFLKVESTENGVCTLTISAPKSLNALNSEILSELNTFVSNIDEHVKVLVITGDGEKAFVAGADIAQMSSMSEAQALEFGKLGAGVFRKIETLAIPVIAAVNGFALGGGCELAISCDIRLASEKAKFGQPEVGLGIIPGFSGTVRLSRLVGPAYAKELIYTGKMIDAQEALRIGLVNSVFAPEQLMEQAIALANKIASNAPCAVQLAKHSINEGSDLSIDEAIKLENTYFSKCFTTADQKEGMDAFLNRRKPSFCGK